jgi:DNA primase large subunit
MKYAYDKLLANSHLKHFGRLQLGLFLKGAGLTLNESMHFWKV